MKRLLITVATLLCLILPAAPALAYNPLGNACGTDRNTTDANGNPINPSICNGNQGVSGAADPTDWAGTSILQKATILVASIAGITAVILIIISGIQMITANGDAGKVAKARGVLIGSLVGLVIIILASAILTFIIGKTVQ